MVFENPTFVELHLHLGNDEETEPETPVRPADMKPEDSTGQRLKMMKILALLGFSIGISVGATMAARRVAAKLRSFRGENPEGVESDDTVLEIT